MSTDFAVSLLSDSSPLAMMFIGMSSGKWNPPTRTAMTMTALINGLTVGSASTTATNDTGTLEVGKKADFVVYNRNLYSVTPQELTNGTVKVLSTRVGGTLKYDARETGLWANSVDLGGGWKWLAWFGCFFSTGIDEGWIYHQEHGWMYCIGTTTSSIWFWTLDMGWLWFSDSVYPSLCRLNPATWLWYLRGGQAPNRWFVNLATGVWEQR